MKLVTKNTHIHPEYIPLCSSNSSSISSSCSSGSSSSISSSSSGSSSSSSSFLKFTEKHDKEYEPDNKAHNTHTRITKVYT